MKFYRVNDNTIKCMIPVSDLTSRGITIEDMVGRKKEALEFLHDVIVMAAEEVGLSDMEQFTTLQLAIVNQDMIVMLASKDETSAEIENFWKELNLQLAGRRGEPEQETVKKTVERKLATPLQRGFLGKQHFVFRFESFYDVLRFAERVHFPEPEPATEFVDIETFEVFTEPAEPVPEELFSALYKSAEEDGYFLLLRAGENVRGLFPTAYCLASEFGTLVPMEEQQVVFLKESAECVFEENALQELGAYALG